jgi:hypothetical protein
MIDFIQNANTTCTAHVQKAKPDDRPVVWSTLPFLVDEQDAGRFGKKTGCCRSGRSWIAWAAAREQRVPHVTRDWA